MKIPADRYNVRKLAGEGQGVRHLLTILLPETFHVAAACFRLRAVMGPNGGRPSADSAALVHVLDGQLWEREVWATLATLRVVLSGDAFRLWDGLNAALEPFEALLLEFGEGESG